MQEDDKSAMLWTGGFLALVVLLGVIAYVAGWLPSMTTT